MTQKCERGDSSHWIREAHPNQPWIPPPRACQCRAPGMPVLTAMRAQIRATHLGLPLRFVVTIDEKGRGIESKHPTYSIHSVVAANSVRGIVRPRASAALTLITSANSVGCRTGKSVGLAPLRISPT